MNEPINPSNPPEPTSKYRTPEPKYHIAFAGGGTFCNLTLTKELLAYDPVSVDTLPGWCRWCAIQYFGLTEEEIRNHGAVGVPEQLAVVQAYAWGSTAHSEAVVRRMHKYLSFRVMSARREDTELLSGYSMDPPVRVPMQQVITTLEDADESLYSPWWPTTWVYPDFQESAEWS